MRYFLSEDKLEQRATSNYIEADAITALGFREVDDVEWRAACDSVGRAYDVDGLLSADRQAQSKRIEAFIAENG